MPELVKYCAPGPFRASGFGKPHSLEIAKMTTASHSRSFLEHLDS